MGLYVGIDLGTTYSAVAKLDEVGKPLIMVNSYGSNITPSVIAIESNGNILVGEDAQRSLGDIDARIAYRFKRKMGTEWVFDAPRQKFTPTDLSAFVLRKLRDDVVEGEGGESIIEAVVTVPANFANEAREATLAAAKAAGINIKYIINEPTAAALYFASQNSGVGGIYAIYDLGGGTFDISIIKIDGEDVEVLSTDGVHELGGRDFDDALIELVKEKYEKSHGSIADEEFSLEFGMNQAEETKKSLSSRESKKLRVLGKNLEVSRHEFEEKISKWIAQAEMLCESAIDEAGVTVSEIKDVILVGGSSRMPIVASSVKRVFKKEPRKFANPDEAVALGAALYAAYKSDGSGLNRAQKKAVESIDISEITSKYFGTPAVVSSKGSEEVQNTIIIERGEKIPCSRTKTYYTRSANQTAVSLRITESQAPETDMNFVKVLWQGELQLPSGRPAQQPIEVSYNYDANQIIHAVFKDVESGKSEEIKIDLGASSNASIDIDSFTVE